MARLSWIDAALVSMCQSNRRWLLASVPAGRVDACLRALRALGHAHAVAIGRVLEQGEALEPIVLTLGSDGERFARINAGH